MDENEEKSLEEFEKNLGRLFQKLSKEGYDLDKLKWDFPDLSDKNRIGDYRVLREIGRGGMGCIVFEAEQISLRRKVALKVLPPHFDHKDKRVVKFRLEAEAGSRQNHPGIVAVYEMGEADGFHYIAQELVNNGKTLADRIVELKRSGETSKDYYRKIAVFIAQVAAALHHAHGSEVIHRDVKPSNILITHDGMPKVTDFGLAKMENALSLSLSGQVIGTPHYMSPEQVEGGGKSVDHRSDIFSLGVTLYEMLTFERPFDADHAHSILNRIVHFDPLPPDRYHVRIPKDLSAICTKAMEKKPADRYADMKEFEEDLLRFSRGETVKAKPYTPMTLLWRKAGRRPFLSGVLALAFLAIMGWLIFGPVMMLTLRSQRDEAEKLKAQSEQQLDEIERLSDIKVLEDLKAQEKGLWPPLPERVVAMQRWLLKADELRANLPAHQETLSALRARAQPYDAEAIRLNRESYPEFTRLQDLKEMLPVIEDARSKLPKGGSSKDWPRYLSTIPPDCTCEYDFDGRVYQDVIDRIDRLEGIVSVRRNWTFNDENLQWRHDILTAFLEEAESFFKEEEGLYDKVKERMAFTQKVRACSIEAHGRAWGEAAAAIADEARYPQYEGLKIKPQVGIVPIGPDPESHLWEFAHLFTGDIPERDENSRLQIEEGTGLVFVLIPGGTFDMGAVIPDDKHQLGDPNVDPEALSYEGPVHRVKVKPFYLSKYEMTQGQWLRVMGGNPSSSRSGGAPQGNHIITLLHPVESVTWEECMTLTARLGMRLPSEKEWEYAARAGTSTIWWTGNDKHSLAGAANLADRYMKQNSGPEFLGHEDWLEDGYTTHAPVGTYRANPFGLHDVHGNVFEWCRTPFFEKTYETHPLQLLRDDYPPYFGTVSHRGGSFHYKAEGCRSASRGGLGRAIKKDNLGLRPAMEVERE
ncbi:MAG: SUMF1/EgtB/PvdO family nonheme iron enzyme [Planctomycetota bacterium]